MPLSNLRVETNMAGQVMDDETWQTYTQNQQTKRSESPEHSQSKTMPVVGPKPVTNEVKPLPKPVAKTVKAVPTKEDKALTKANKKDLKTRNIK